MCLGCGYDLRGLSAAGREQCPECGRGVALDDLLQQLSRLKTSHNPVWTESAIGLIILASVFPLSLVVVVPATVLVSLLFEWLRVSGDAEWLIAGPLIVVWGLLFLAWFFSIWLAYRVFQSKQGVAIWCLIQGLLFAKLAALFYPAALLLMWIGTVSSYWIDGHPRRIDWGMMRMRWPIEVRVDEWPVYALTAASLLLFYGLVRLTHRLVNQPCRRRCLELAELWLARSEAFAGPAAEKTGEPVSA
ncbi:MAG: hypothetical protein AAGJ38_05140 [Planctomycetota bacterium]